MHHVFFPNLNIYQCNATHIESRGNEATGKYRNEKGREKSAVRAWTLDEISLGRYSRAKWN